MDGAMTVTTHPDDSFVVGLSVLYEDEPDGRVIARIPQVLGAISRGDDRRSARAGVRGALRDLIPGLPHARSMREDLGPEERRIA
jgi:hypothetical protein